LQSPPSINVSETDSDLKPQSAAFGDPCAAQTNDQSAPQTNDNFLTAKVGDDSTLSAEKTLPRDSANSDTVEKTVSQQ